MDGDRSMADGCDIFESKLQELFREAFERAWTEGLDNVKNTYPDDYFARLHELRVSYFDNPTSHVGSQDETTKARTMGDRIRPKAYLSVINENDPIRAIHDEVCQVVDKMAESLAVNFKYEGTRLAIGHGDIKEKPDGTLYMTLYFYPTKPQVDEAL